MIKLTFCLVRLPTLSREQFQDYWLNTHAPLVASVKDVLRIRRYVQLHSLPPEVSADIRASRDAPETTAARYHSARRFHWRATVQQNLMIARSDRGARKH